MSESWWKRWGVIVLLVFMVPWGLSLDGLLVAYGEYRHPGCEIEPERRGYFDVVCAPEADGDPDLIHAWLYVARLVGIPAPFFAALAVLFVARLLRGRPPVSFDEVPEP